MVDYNQQCGNDGKPAVKTALALKRLTAA